MILAMVAVSPRFQLVGFHTSPYAQAHDSVALRRLRACWDGFVRPLF
jgi:hypothetical protein